MNSREFVHDWLNKHRSPQQVYDATPEEQEHFESLLTDLLDSYIKYKQNE